MIPAREHWHDLETAPRDGSIFMALYREYGDHAAGKIAVQPVQYLCNEYGTDFRFRSPWRPGSIAYADAWMTLEELIAWQDKAGGVEAHRAAVAAGHAETLGDDLAMSKAEEYDL